MPQQPNNGWTPVDETAAPDGWTPVQEQSKRGVFGKLLDWATTPGPLQQNASKPTGEMPGSFEGHPENVGEYVPQSAGEILGGSRDVVRGDVSKGMHRVISGAGNALLPAAPFVAAAAPVATGVAMATGAVGQQVGKRGAQALGATEDQSDLAGDITGLASGFGSTKLPAGKIAASMKVLSEPAADAASKLPVIDKFVGAGKALGKYRNVPGELSDIWKTKFTDPGAPLPETSPQSRLPEAFQPAKPQAPAVSGTVDNPFQAPPQRGSIAQSMQSSEPAPIQRGSLSKMLSQQLNDALGAKELNPKLPLRQQLDTGATDMPQGHTAVNSSAMKSYQYDPAAKEFHARYASGGDTTHVFGDVSPDEAQAFEKAPSKGQAMQAIKNNHPLVAKIVNGKRVSVRGSISAGMAK